MRLLIATSNPGKLRELRQLLAHTALEIVGLDTLTDPPVVIEDGATFRANAEKKARTLADFSGLVTLADDSGLCVDALGGAPGVHSARYAGHAADDAANNARLLQELGGLPAERRHAYFHCSLALAWPAGRCQTFSGRVDGRILEAPRGTGGFGYDPLFFVPQYNKTMAELPGAEKNRISHRAAALREALPVIAALGKE
ncbi:MAG: XTP/dITP diphosphatase [Pelovirga sp.]